MCSRWKIRAGALRARNAIALLGAALAVAAPLHAAGTEQALRAAWVGRWVVLRTAAFSNCDERYTDNRFDGGQPVSKGDYRFAAGELGRVDNLTVRRARIDLLVELDEPLRIEFRDGPFQLFEQVVCRVELELRVPRVTVRQDDIEPLDARILGVLEPHAGRAAATASAAWNRRQVRPLPADYEERLAAYREWKEHQLMVALRDRLAEALDRAVALAPRGGESAGYEQGLVRGAREFDDRGRLSAGCETLVGLHFTPSRSDAPAEFEGAAARDWEEGFRDGQRLERCLPAPG